MELKKHEAIKAAREKKQAEREVKRHAWEQREKRRTRRRIYERTGVKVDLSTIKAPLSPRRALERSARSRMEGSIVGASLIEVLGEEGRSNADTLTDGGG